MTRKSIPHLRWWIAGLLCLASALNYLDRQTLSVLIGTIKEQLNLSHADYGKINSWFLLSYAVMYAVSGRIVDIIGTRRSFVLFVCGWSVANMLHIFARTVGQFSFYRFLLGVFEPGSFTGGVRAVSEWFPMRERALAIGIFNAGTAVGSVTAAPVVGFIALRWGWQAAFLVTGALGFVWAAAWLVLFRQPAEHPLLGEAERRLIVAEQRADAGGEQAVPLAALLRMRELWGCVLVRALTDPISYFLLFWMPLYFQKSHGFDLKQVAMFVWIPYAMAAVGNVCSGAIPRWFIAVFGWDVNRARKTMMTAMTCCWVVLCLGAPFVGHPALALALVAGLWFCHAGWANITLPAEVFPKNAVGTVTGLGGMVGSAMGVVSQRFVIGDVVDQFGFAPLFIGCAALYPLAMLVVQLMIGRLGVTRAIPQKSG
ncbi:MAG: MFS transporter [Verrucomicrobiae bacterium]|nr:MFS transporter [Verrucomicrobiae bacterium]